ncbi:hypothetical protein BJ741DRAFT_647317 [Chytriomyces cf. hyalinus JEL632]|nr:hypothetical protein BJ741DRAFT_647317 [Chytriomyces cf. hyalinus JEL632]
MSAPQLSDDDLEAEAILSDTDFEDAIVGRSNASEDSNVSDDEVRTDGETHYNCMCALCKRCLICGSEKGNCTCSPRDYTGLMTGIYRDVSVYATTVSAFLQYRDSPLPKLPPGEYLPKVKLCLIKGNGCHKKYSNWKETATGKAAMERSTLQELPSTPKLREKPVKSQRAPNKVKVSHFTEEASSAAKGDDRNDAPTKETSDSKKRKDAQLSVSLHTCINSKGVSTLIESVKLAIPDVESFEDLWKYLETNLEKWNNLLWDRSKFYYTEGVSKSPNFYAIHNWLQFTGFLELVHTALPSKKPILIIRQVREQPSSKAHSADSGKQDADLEKHSGSWMSSRTGRMLSLLQKLDDLYSNNCAENPSGCLHDNIDGVDVHLRLTSDMKSGWAAQIGGKVEGVDLHTPPTSLDEFNLENYKPVQKQWSKKRSIQGVLQTAVAAPVNASNLPLPEMQSSAPANGGQPRTIRFFRRTADSTVASMTGRLCFEESDTVASMLKKARFPTVIPGKLLSAWEMGEDSDRQFLFDGNLKTTLNREHTDILIKAEDESTEPVFFY